MMRHRLTRAALLITTLVVSLEAEAKPGRGRARETISVTPSTAEPGDAVLITVRPQNDTGRAPTGTLGDRRLEFFPSKRGFQAIAALPIEQETGTLEVRVDVPGDDRDEKITQTIEVVAPNFKTVELTVDPVYVEPPEEMKARIAEDDRAIARALSQPSSELTFDRAFRWPRAKKLTARFGDIRHFNGTFTSQHHGVDLAGRAGAPARAANEGKVVLARDCFYEGGTVIVHHGGTLYTVYFHLDHMTVSEGDTIKRGQKLGTIGEKGRTTGPHLHYGVHVDGKYVNPETFMRLPLTPARARAS